MANDGHIAQLKKGAAAWNAWRKRNPNIRPDLTKAKLSRRDLRKANLSDSNLRGAILRGAKLSGADLRGAAFIEADLRVAKLRRADLRGAHFKRTKLRRADLRRADLNSATLVEVDLTGADLRGCRVYGISGWGLKLDRATKQQNLLITRDREISIERVVIDKEPEITLDNIEVAQFIYLMLNNQKVRDVIDTVTSKAVLILGRFTPERKAVLDALRKELRKRDYLPILFDFAVPARRNITETVTLLARMARFIIADLTDPSSIPQELQAIVPDLAVPVHPIVPPIVLEHCVGPR